MYLSISISISISTYLSMYVFISTYLYICMYTYSEREREVDLVVSNGVGGEVGQVVDLCGESLDEVVPQLVSGLEVITPLTSPPSR